MAAIRVTFTFDPATIIRLNDAAKRLSKPKNEIVREAIEEYHQRITRLSDSDKQRMLKVLDEIANRPPTRPQIEVEAELKEIRRARRHGGRRRRYSS